MDLSKIEKQSGDIWTNNEKQSVPIAYVSKLQKMEEKKVHAIFTIFKNAYNNLYNKKKEVIKHVEQLVTTYYQENKLEQDQGSFTFYNFDKTLQLEIDSSQPLEYDVNLLEQASQHFKEYLNQNTENIDKALRTLIEELLLNVQKNRMNTGTVKKLEKAGRAVDHPEMDKAVELIEKAQGRGQPKVYYRIRVKNPDNGKYELLDVNFSAIEIEE